MELVSLEEFGKIYAFHFGENVSHSEVERSYKYWVDYQTRSDNTPPEEKKKPYVIWEEFPTAESWIVHKKKDMEARIAASKATQEWFAKPWYERETDGVVIQTQLIDAFIKDLKGIEIRHSLCVWDLEATDLFEAIKHFSTFVGVSEVNIDNRVKDFIERNKDILNGWGVGICGDGGRVLRTLSIACYLFYDQEVLTQNKETT